MTTGEGNLPVSFGTGDIPAVDSEMFDGVVEQPGHWV